MDQANVVASLAEIMVSFVGTVPMSLRSAVHRGLEFYGFSPQWRLRKQGRNLAHLNIDTSPPDEDLVTS